jgi:hypothetical protein
MGSRPVGTEAKKEAKSRERRIEPIKSRRAQSWKLGRHKTEKETT